MAAASPNTATSPAPLTGRVAIVTGASRGIGRAIAAHLASLGASLVVGYASNSAEADRLAAELNSSSPSDSPRAVTVRVDVSDPAAVKSLFDAAESAFRSPAHILVNSAGILNAKYPTVAATDIEDWETTFAVNARGAFLCCREAANRLARGGGGRIICVTTSLVGAPRPGYAAYTASKAAVETMVKTMAKELRGTGITANCVAPGAVATELFFAGKTEEMVRRVVGNCPLGRLGETKDIAPVVGFLCTDAGEWVNGQVLRVNGGSISS